MIKGRKNVNFRTFDPVDVLKNKKWVPPKVLDPTEKHNSLCELCNRAIGQRHTENDLLCLYCNVSVHRSCLFNDSNQLLLSLPLNLTKDIQESAIVACKQPENVDFGSWTCFYCIDSIKESRRVFELHINTAKNIKTLIAAQSTIAKYWRRWRDRRTYLRIYRVALTIQIWYRLKRNKVLFLKRKMEKLRPVVITIDCCENLTICQDKTTSTGPAKSSKQAVANYYIVATAIEMVDGVEEQRWSESSPIHALLVPLAPVSTRASFHQSKELICNFNHDITLAGVSGHQIIALTVLQKGQKRDFVLGQTSLQLSHHHLWKRGGSFKRNLEEAKHLLQDKNGLDLKHDYSTTPQGTISFKLSVFPGMQAECGHVHAPPLDDYIRALHKIPPSMAFFIQHHHGTGTAERRNSMSSMSASFSHASSSQEGEEGEGALGHAVPLTAAAVKEAAEAAAAAIMGNLPSPAAAAEVKMPILPKPADAVDPLQFSKKKLWVSLMKGAVHIYSHFGGPLSLVLNLIHFDYSIQYSSDGSHMAFSLHRLGFPSFHFAPLDKADFVRWKCALICGLRYVIAPVAPFDMDAFVQDVGKVNKVLRQQKLYLQSHPPRTAHSHGHHHHDSHHHHHQHHQNESHHHHHLHHESHHNAHNHHESHHTLAPSHVESAGTTAAATAALEHSNATHPVRRNSFCPSRRVSKVAPLRRSSVSGSLSGTDQLSPSATQPVLHRSRSSSFAMNGGGVGEPQASVEQGTALGSLAPLPPQRHRSRLLNSLLPFHTLNGVGEEEGHTSEEQARSDQLEALLENVGQGKPSEAFALKSALSDMNELDDLIADDHFTSKAQSFAGRLLLSAVEGKLKA